MSNECEPQQMKAIELIVQTEALPRFTTLLQSGIYVDLDQGTSIGEFLFALPGFSEEYVNKSVQTIFLNGLPADNLQQQLFGKEAVIAISAAMPGLAGAIFRKDGVHASLRTTTAAELSSKDALETPITIRLKLFNMIAMDRGEELLSNTCIIAAKSLRAFLSYRPPLCAAIQKTTLNGEIIDANTLQELLSAEDLIKLTIRDK
jgi:hypothetical protein